MSVAKALSTNTMKTIQIFAVAFALLMVYAVMPAPAHAAALTDAQTQAVINLLSSFGADQATLSNVSLALRGASKEDILKAVYGSSTAPTKDRIQEGIKQVEDKIQNIKTDFPGASACGILQRTLLRGSQGDDVVQLQGFLQQSGDFANGSTTGFFGPATEHALQAWQARMGVVSSGDASSSGFGALGPKTRQAFMMHCKEMGDMRPGSNGSTTPFGNNTSAPTCVLKANKSAIQVGDTVTLVWESRNATSASSVTGERGPANGSVTVAPTETMTYLKRVYGPAGEGQCTTTVRVGDDMTPAAEQKVVVVPTTLDVGKVFSLMGDGMASVMDGYLSLFGLSLEQY